MLPNLFYRIMFFDKLHTICTRYRCYGYSEVFLRRQNFVQANLKIFYFALHFVCEESLKTPTTKNCVQKCTFQ